MIEIPIEEVYDLREDLKFATGTWLSGETIPVAPDYPILGIVTYTNSIGGSVSVYTILIWDGSKWNTRYIDDNGLGGFVGVQRELVSSASITRWKQLDNELPGSGLRGDYYIEPDWTYGPNAVEMSNVDFTWLTAGPENLVPPNSQYSIRWSGYVKVPVTGNYRFRITCDDSVIFYASDIRMVSSTGIHASRAIVTGYTTLVQGYESLLLEYANLSGTGGIKLEWERTTAPGFKVIPVSSLYIPSYVIS